MLLFLGSDHAGFKLKNAIICYLEKNKIKIEDLGVYNENKDSNYSEIAEKVSLKVVSGDFLGIICCGSGIGVSIAANKVNGIRAALCFNRNYAELARKHNNANVLCLGERMISTSEAITTVSTFISTEFEGERHLPRVNYISSIERNNSKR
ncbi:MAG: ribose 5-phosphate isomerase B [Candidatus Improbicoccus pseudotrichonymphae]|uniref:Ribose 5-phosphate isomerase B n=1 Tax=Candidatus Improbicoccus pseudotrichonymphae TaxID=3033792 RepID=A0AA48L0Z2_9FIRM|nr:MAG: ribose 5-phosphate isomerase B [Candidatus Improbicoccus pseudotrichonymphae]